MTDMICTCRLDGIKEVVTMRAEAARRLAVASTRDLMPAVIMSLAFDFGADARVYMDQWFGVELQVPGRQTRWIECDWPADGLLRLWLDVARESPERVTRGPGGRLDEQETMRLLERIGAAEAVQDAHMQSFPEDQRASHYCKTCEQNHKPEIEAHHALDELWGCGALDAAVAEA